MASGLVELESDEDVLNLVNRSLLLALSIPLIFLLSPCTIRVSHAKTGLRVSVSSISTLQLLQMPFFHGRGTVGQIAHSFTDAEPLGKLQSVLAGVHFRPSLTRSQIEWKQIHEDIRWNKFTKDATGRLPVVVDYEPDGSPFLWHLGNKYRVHLPASTQTVSLEPVSFADKVTVSSRPEEVSRAELGVD